MNPDTHDSTPGILKIWDAAAAGITELEMRKASGLGQSTVSRIKNTLLVNGHLREAGHAISPKDGRTKATIYYQVGTREAVAKAFTRKPRAGKRNESIVLNGEGIGRVPSVFALAARMGLQ